MFGEEDPETAVIDIIAITAGVLIGRLEYNGVVESKLVQFSFPLLPKLLEVSFEVASSSINVTVMWFLLVCDCNIRCS